MAKAYRTIRKPHTYLLNSRNGYISICRSGKVITVNLVTTEKYNQHHELYTEIEYWEFLSAFDEFTAKCTEIFQFAETKTFTLGNRVPDVLKKAKEAI